MYQILTNKIRCRFCGDIIQSRSVHEFVKCRCGKCFTDGGLDYIRRGFEGDDPKQVYDDLTEYLDPETGKILTASEVEAANVPTKTEPQPTSVPTMEVPPTPKSTAPKTPAPTLDIPEVTEESKDDEPKKKPTKGRYDWDTGKTIKEE